MCMCCTVSLPVCMGIAFLAASVYSGCDDTISSQHTVWGMGTLVLTHHTVSGEKDTAPTKLEGAPMNMNWA